MGLNEPQESKTQEAEGWVGSLGGLPRGGRRGGERAALLMYAEKQAGHPWVSHTHHMPCEKDQGPHHWQVWAGTCLATSSKCVSVGLWSHLETLSVCLKHGAPFHCVIGSTKWDHACTALSWVPGTCEPSMNAMYQGPPRTTHLLSLGKVCLLCPGWIDSKTSLIWTLLTYNL